MSKKEEKIVEAEFQEVNAEGEVEQAKAKYVVVIAVDQDGKIQVQDGKQLFSENSVEEEINEEVVSQVIKVLHKQVEEAEFAAKVREVVAQSLGGGKK